jgi:hypothetical protein
VAAHISRAAVPTVARQGRIVEEMDIAEATETKIMYAAVH